MCPENSGDQPPEAAAAGPEQRLAQKLAQIFSLKANRGSRAQAQAQDAELARLLRRPCGACRSQAPREEAEAAVRPMTARAGGCWGRWERDEARDEAGQLRAQLLQERLRGQGRRCALKQERRTWQEEEAGAVTPV